MQRAIRSRHMFHVKCFWAKKWLGPNIKGNNRCQHLSEKEVKFLMKVRRSSLQRSVVDAKINMPESQTDCNAPLLWFQQSRVYNWFSTNHHHDFYSAITKNNVDTSDAIDITPSNRSWLVVSLEEDVEYRQLASLYHHSEQVPWSPPAACRLVHLSS